MQEERHCTLQWLYVFSQNSTHLGQYRRPFQKSMLSVACKVIRSWLSHNMSVSDMQLLHVTEQAGKRLKDSWGFEGILGSMLEDQHQKLDITIKPPQMALWACPQIERRDTAAWSTCEASWLLQWLGRTCELPWWLAASLGPCLLLTCELSALYEPWSFLCFGTLCEFLRFVVWCALIWKVVWCWIWSAEPNSGAINLILPHVPDVRIGKSDDKRIQMNKWTWAVDAIRTRETDD